MHGNSTKMSNFNKSTLSTDVYVTNSRVLPARLGRPEGCRIQAAKLQGSLSLFMLSRYEIYVLCVTYMGRSLFLFFFAVLIQLPFRKASGTHFDRWLSAGVLIKKLSSSTNIIHDCLGWASEGTHYMTCNVTNIYN